MLKAIRKNVKNMIKDEHMEDLRLPINECLSTFVPVMNLEIFYL